MMAIFTQKLNRQTKITFTTNFQNSILKNIKRNKKKNDTHQCIPKSSMFTLSVCFSTV